MRVDELKSLVGHFLIAIPGMEDPHFSRTLTYICEHTEKGALGIVVNRPISMTLGMLYERLSLPLGRLDLIEQPIYFGGPVQPDRGFVLHKTGKNWQSTLTINPEISLTTSKDILETLGSAEECFDVKDVLITLGYSSWGAGQLESEIFQNMWLTVVARSDIIFDLPAHMRFGAATHILGFEPTQLTGFVGHA